MREIKEYTTEVFRRSEKRIKDRKRKRNRILVLCIPACLILATFSAIFLPALMPIKRTYDETYGSAWDFDGNGNANGMAWDASYSDSAAEMFEEAFLGVAGVYTVVEIQIVDSHPAYSERVTDREVIANLFDTIHSFFIDADMVFSDVEGEHQADNEDFVAGDEAANQEQADSSSQWKVYTILFTTEDGSQTVYQLSRNILSNGDTKQTVVLSDAQVAELLTVFGIFE